MRYVDVTPIRDYYMRACETDDTVIHYCRAMLLMLYLRADVTCEIRAVNASAAAYIFTTDGWVDKNAR